MNELVKQDWYQQLIEDCKDIIVESVFTSRWALIEGYHLLGKRILEENDNFKRAKIYGQEITSHVSQSLDKSKRTIERAIQFVRQYPDISKLPEGKNISWHKIVNKYLPAPKTEAPELPKGKYNVIYADPPWKYSDKLIEGYGAAEHHYPAMSIKQLCELDVKNIVADNAVLFLWVTSPMLDECWPVIKAWGFEYKTSFVWNKVKHNYGHYNSVRHEFLLICTKGSYLPQNNKLFDSVQTIERTRKHSEKPEQFRKLIQSMYPKGKRIELFARKKYPNWDTYGDDPRIQSK